MLASLGVFCGSSSGMNPRYAEMAREMGLQLAKRGIQLVYGGSDRGLMGVLADGCLRAGGRVIGVIPEHFVEKEIAHPGLGELIVVPSMHARKAAMAERSEAFIAMPGGFGTWDELCEVLTWSQLDLHRKPCALLNVEGYYDPLLAMADRAVSEGFVHPAHRGLLLTHAEPAGLLDILESRQLR